MKHHNPLCWLRWTNTTNDYWFKLSLNDLHLFVLCSKASVEKRRIKINDLCRNAGHFLCFNCFAQIQNTHQFYICSNSFVTLVLCVCVLDMLYYVNKPLEMYCAVTILFGLFFFLFVHVLGSLALWEGDRQFISLNELKKKTIWWETACIHK